MYCVKLTLGENEDVRVVNEEERINVVESVWEENEVGEAVCFMYDIVDVFVENIENVVWVEYDGNMYVPYLYDIEGTLDDDLEVVNVYQWEAL